MPANDGGTYDVGFGKPPKRTRFPRGVSGNPKGRPKGKQNLSTILEQTLQEMVVIEENGMRRTVTKIQAAVMQLVNKATSGDLAALRQLTALANAAEAQVVDTPKKQLAGADLKVMQGVLHRLQGCSKREDDEN